MRVLLLILLILAGCRAAADQQAANGRAKVADSIATVAEPLARAEVRREQMAGWLPNLKPTLYADLFAQGLADQKADLSDAKTALQNTRTTAQGQLDISEGRRLAAVASQVKAEDATAKLAAKWYCVAGRWVERLILWVIITYTALGIGGVLLCAFGGPWGLLAGREILGLLPVANIFTNVARWMGK